MSDKKQHDKPSSGGPSDDENPPMRRYFWWMLLLVLVAIVITQLLASPMVTGEVPLSYSEIKAHIRDGDIEKVMLTDDTLIAIPTEEALEEARAEHPDIDFKRWRSTKMRDDASLIELLDTHNVEYEARYTEGCEGSFVWFWLIGMVGVFLVWSMFLRRGGMGGANRK